MSTDKLDAILKGIAQLKNSDNLSVNQVPKVPQPTTPAEHKAAWGERQKQFKETIAKQDAVIKEFQLKEKALEDRLAKMEQLLAKSINQVPTAPAAPATISSNKPKIGYEQFARTLITQLRDEKKSKGIHVVFSGFNNAMKQYYGDTVNPRDVTQALVNAGKLKIRYVKKGAMIYLPEDYKEFNAATDIKL